MGLRIWLDLVGENIIHGGEKIAFFGEREREREKERERERERLSLSLSLSPTHRSTKIII